MTRLGLSIACLLFLSSPLYASSVSLFFNDSSAQVGYQQPIAQDNYGLSQLSARFLYNDDEDTTLGSVGFNFVGEPGNVPGLDLGIGAKAYGGHTSDNQDLLSLGVGGEIMYAPPVFGGFGGSVRLFYGPEIFTGLDAERLLETGLRLTYAITPRVRLGLEYQRISSKFEGEGTWTIDEGVRAGFIASF